MKAPAAVICVSLWVFTALHASHTGPKCGVPQVSSPMDHTLRIVGGAEARHGSHPWLVSLRNKGSHFCGGAILSDRWIMTAAHCFTSVSKEFLSRVSVVVAEFDQRVRDEEEQILLIKSVFIHEKYQHALPMSYDIALLELDELIRLGGRVQPICLPLPNESTPRETSCIMGGWGRLRERGRLPKVLREVQLDLLEPARCKYVLQTVRTSFQNQDPSQSHPALTVLCAGPEKGGKDACQGDSGGPLVCPVRGTGRWVAVGVTSWGKGCGRSWGDNAGRPPSKRGSPGLFSDVRLLLPWIKSTLRDAAGKHKGKTLPRLCGVRDGPLTVIEGIIRNPALPGHHYDNNELCSWIIRVPPGHSILLEFNHFELENDSYCLHDRLTVSIGARRPVATFCGSIIPGPVLLNNIQSATLFFSSDITETRSGFAVRHHAILRATQAHSDGCGTVVLVEDQNVIHSPNYPQSYSNDSVCRWVIYAPQGHIVKLDFQDFYLEESEGCLYDALSVLGDLDGTEEIAVLCGSRMPPPVLSYDSVMVVQFTTDSTVTHTGFQATTAFISHTDLHEQETVNGEGETDKRTNEQTAHTDDLAANVRHVTPHGPNDDGEEGPQQQTLPWDMHLYLGKEFLCYGVLIQTHWILITAHCSISLEEKSFSRLWVITTGPDRQRRRVSRVVLHPHYQPFLGGHDAALLQLSSPLRLTEHTQTICMQNKEEEQETLSIQQCTVSGDLKKMTVHTNQVCVISHAECEEHYTSGLPHAMLCVRASAQNHSQHHCIMGGLGTTLVCERAHSNYVLMGLRSEGQQIETGGNKRSEGYGSSHLQTPAVFTSVAALRDWIQKQISVDPDLSEPVDHLPDRRPTSHHIVTDDQESLNPREFVDLSSDDEDYDTESSGGCVNCWND